MRLFKKVFLALAIGLVLFACDEATVESPPLPPEFSVTTTNLSASSVEVKVTITNNLADAKEIGFVWGKQQNPTLSDQVFTYSTAKNIYTFKSTITELDVYAEYHVRVFIVTESNETLYSEDNLFVTGSHELTTFDPGSAEIGTKVQLKGKWFENGKTSVFFDDKQVDFDFVNSGLLEVTTPAGFEAKKISISIKMGDHKLTYGKTLTYKSGRWTKLNITNPGASGVLGHAVVSQGRPYMFNLCRHQLFSLDLEGLVWNLEADYPIPFSSGSCPGIKLFSIENNIYTIHSKNLVFDTGSKEWIEIPTANGATNLSVATAAFSSEYKGYVIYNNKMYKWSPVSSQWSSIADNPLSFGATYPSEQGLFAIVSTGDLRGLWRFSPADEAWEKVSVLPNLAIELLFAGFVIGDRLYISVRAGGFITTTTEFWEYRMPTKEWNEVASFPRGRGGMYAFVIDGKGYMGGGIGSDGADVWMFEP